MICRLKSRHSLQIILSCLLVFLISVTGSYGQMRIMPLGNSITYDHNSFDQSDPRPEGERISYRMQLYNLLNGAGYSFDFVGHKNAGYTLFPDGNNAGIPGILDEHIVELLQNGYDDTWNEQITSSYGVPYLDEYPTDMILLHIGTNDIIQGQGSSAATVSQILDEIDAYEVRSGNPVEVFVARIIYAYPITNSRNSTIFQFNNNVEAMIDARGDASIHVVDMQGSLDYDTDMIDEFHPNPQGYTKMAYKWFEAISNLNVAPVFVSSPVLSAQEDNLYTYNVVVDDANESDFLTISAITLPDWLDFTDNGNRTGTLTGTPDNGDVGLHPVLLRVTDGIVTVDQSFSIDVDNENDPPVITGHSYISTPEDISFDLSLSDLSITDIDNTIDDLRLLVFPGSNYGYSGTTITPALNYDQDILVNIKVTDQIDTTDTYVVTIDVVPVNDPPVISDQISTLSTKEDTPLLIVKNNFAISDVDNSLNELSLVVNSGENYTLAGNTITPVSGFTGTLSVPVVVEDNDDASEVFNCSVEVKSAYNPPEFTSVPPDTAVEDQFLIYSVRAIDIDEDPILYFADSLPDWLSFNSSSHIVGGVPSSADIGEHYVLLHISDGTHTVYQEFTILVIGGNDQPVIIGQSTIHIDVNSSYELKLEDLEVEDEDNTYPDEFTLSVESGEHYQIQGNRITPDTDYSGYLIVPVKVNDGIIDSEEAEITIGVGNTSIITLSADNKLIRNLYPVPASNFLHFKISTDIKDATVEVYDLSGKIYENFLIIKGKEEYRIEVSSFEPGLYFLRICDRHLSETKKFIINR